MIVIVSIVISAAALVVILETLGRMALGARKGTQHVDEDAELYRQHEEDRHAS